MLSAALLSRKSSGAPSAAGRSQHSCNVRIRKVKGKMCWNNPRPHRVTLQHVWCMEAGLVSAYLPIIAVIKICTELNFMSRQCGHRTMAISPLIHSFCKVAADFLLYGCSSNKMHNAQFVHLILDICKRCSIHLITLTYGLWNLGLRETKVQIKYFEWQIIQLLPAVTFLVRELIHDHNNCSVITNRSGG